MKILCLHPWGTSGLIFEKQLGVLTGILDPSHEWVYINGGKDCGRARELPDFVPGPYYSWYEGLSSPECQEAHDIITETIAEEGPFDGVVGFSQGASLALSYLLHHAITSGPSSASPFRFALFFCTNLVISPDPKFNADKTIKYARYYTAAQPALPVSVPNLTTKSTDNTNSHSSDSESESPPAPSLSTTTTKTSKSAPKHRALLLLPSQKLALVNELVELVSSMTHNLPSSTAPAASWPTNPTPADFPRVYHPLTTKARVAIPTVHVIGEEDPLATHGELAVRLCEKRGARVVRWKGGHRIPVAVGVLRGIVREWEGMLGRVGRGW